MEEINLKDDESEGKGRQHRGTLTCSNNYAYAQTMSSITTNHVTLNACIHSKSEQTGEEKGPSKQKVYSIKRHDE